MDSEERWLTNWRDRKQELEKYGWLDCKFDYKFNSQGFRSPEFTNDPTIMFLGCSFTMGMGLPFEDLWTTLVTKELGLAQANLAQAGTSADTAFRMTLGWLDKIKPKILIYMQPPAARFELVNEQTTRHYISNDRDDIYSLWAEDHNNEYFNREKNRLAIEQLCSQQSVKLMVVNHEYLTGCSTDLARDLAHPGRKNSRLMASWILDQL